MFLFKLSNIIETALYMYLRNFARMHMMKGFVHNHLYL